MIVVSLFFCFIGKGFDSLRLHLKVQGNNISEFHKVELLVDDKISIVKSLEEMGYTPQLHEEAKALHGYQGDIRNQKAHIILPKLQVGRASNDIGFEKKVDGKYILHISKYDIGAKTFDTTKFKVLYQKHKVENKLINSNRFRKIGTKVDEKGNIRIRLTRR